MLAMVATTSITNTSKTEALLTYLNCFHSLYLHALSYQFRMVFCTIDSPFVKRLSGTQQIESILQYGTTISNSF